MLDRRRVEELFHRALELEGPAQAAFVRAQCAGDEALAHEVLSLLEHDSDGAGTLSGLAASVAAFEAGAEQPGDRIGPYELVERVGEGGFGSVYRATQHEPVRREVALKLIKLGMDTRRVTRRFEAERQTLASMDHPHIARAFDAGATEFGRPYFVMEFVPGEPVTTYCDARRLPIEERLALFRQICAGVEHAHQKAIIHRDLKPSNILVQTIDGRPFVKVIDFGIAKALGEADDAPGVTVEGLPIGTPAYMSPEQALGQWRLVDTRSDVYALGVVLYELLTGSLPIERDERAPTLEEVRRSIDAHAPRPSTRVRTQTREAAEARGLDPASLTRRLRGDLDWIILKAIEKDPARRYAGVAELSGDVERHLEHRPILAAAPSARYRASKFVRRHRVGVVVTAIVALALLAGLIGTGVGFARAVRAERQAQALAADEAAARVLAEQRFEQVRGIGKKLIFDVRDAVADVPGATEAHRLIVDTGLEYLEALASEAAGNAALLREVSSGYQRLAQVMGEPSRQNVGDQAGALRCLDRAEELTRSIPGFETDADAHRVLGVIARSKGSIQLALGRTEEALESMERGVELTRHGAELDPTLDFSEDIALGHASLARMQQTLGHDEEAIEGYREYIQYARSRMEAEPDNLMHPRNISVLLNRIANLRSQRLGDDEGALVDLEESLRLMEGIVEKQPDNSLYVGTLGNTYEALGLSLYNLDRLDEALERFEHVHELAMRAVELDPENQITQRGAATAHYWLGLVHVKRGDADLAIEHLREYARRLDSMIERYPDYVVLRRDRTIAFVALADALAEGAQLEPAIEEAERAVEAIDALSQQNPTDSELRLDRLRHRRSLANLRVRFAEGAPAPDAGERGWAPARRVLQEALAIALELEGEGMLPPADAEAPGAIREQIARCDAALAGE